MLGKQLTAEDTVDSIDELDLIVSSDDHISEEWEELFEYIDDDYSGIKRWLEQTNKYTIQNEIFSKTPPLPPYGNTGKATKRPGSKYLEEKDTVAETRIAQMDDFGIDHSVIDPGRLLTIGTVQNYQAAAALANGYNPWLLEQIEDYDRLHMSLGIAPQKPDAAAEEIDRYADEDSVIGVSFPASGHTPPVSREYYDPIYQAAEDNDLPILMHGSYPAMSHAFPLQNRNHQIFMEDKIIAHPFSQMWNLMLMILEGIPERFPGVNFVFQESGIGWIPYWTWRLDDYYLTYPDETPMLTKLPSEYINESFNFTTQPVGHTARNSEHLAWAVEMAGADSLMWAADLPHSDFDTPDELFDRINQHFDSDTVRGIMGETADDLFGLTN